LAIINIQLEKTQISARTPGHWRNQKVVESMPLSPSKPPVAIGLCGKTSACFLIQLTRKST